MKRIRFAAFLLAAALALAACSPAAPQAVAAQPEATGTASPSPAATLAGTVQWFPATRTPTPMATLPVVPTADQRPGVGEEILSDDFSKAVQWSTGSFAAGTVSLSGGELTLANPGEKGYLLSLRNNTALGDFYLEITSNLSLCRGDDQYGVVVRALSAQDYYRFVVACNSKVRLERVKNGSTALLQDWVTSGQVPPGSPLVIKLGVWAVRNQLHFFIDDMFQYSASDPVLIAGSVGVFSRSSGANPLTVSYSDMKVYSVDASRIVFPTNTPPPWALPPATLPAVPPTATLRAATPTPVVTLSATPTKGPTPTYTPVFMHP